MLKQTLSRGPGRSYQRVGAELEEREQFQQPILIRKKISWWLTVSKAADVVEDQHGLEVGRCGCVDQLSPPVEPVSGFEARLVVSLASCSCLGR